MIAGILISNIPLF